MELGTGETGSATLLSSGESSVMSTNDETGNTTMYTMDKEIAQYNADAGLMAEFEQSRVSGKSFKYARSVLHAPQSVPEEHITAYFSRMQRGGLIQPIGCLLTIEEPLLESSLIVRIAWKLLALDSQFESKEFKVRLDTRSFDILSYSYVTS